MQGFVLQHESQPVKLTYLVPLPHVQIQCVSGDTSCFCKSPISFRGTAPEEGRVEETQDKTLGIL